MNNYLLPASGGAALLLLTSLASAQAPTIINVTPVANTSAAPRNGGVVASFSQPLTPASATALKVFSSQRGGLRGGGAATVIGANLGFFPTAYDFQPGETVQCTVTRTAASVVGGLAIPRVQQFTTAVGGTGTGSFAPGTEVPVGVRPTSVAVGDVDNDGDLDLLTGNLGEPTVSVRLNNGHGTYGGSQDVPVASYSLGLTLGDVDGDGDLDLLSANFTGNTVSVRFNNGSGLFGSGADVPAGYGPQGLALGDLDGDGDLDFVATNRDADSVSVRFNNGSGSFGGSRGVAVGDGPQGLALSDVDNDGDLDLLASNLLASSVSVRLNNGNGTFGSGQEVPTGGQPFGIALGDVDGDADADLLAVSYLYNGIVSVRLNNGSGTFSGTQNVAVRSYPPTVVLGDVDHDGDLDLLTANSGNSTASVRLNNGSGTFGGGADVSVGDVSIAPSTPNAVAVADVDDDGDLDLLSANTTTAGTVSVRLNNASGPLATAVAAPAALTAYPNPAGHGPATGRVQLSLPPAATHAELLDALGRTVRTVPAQAGTATLVVSGLPPGLYLMRAAGQVARLVVE
ncbi:T9SS type A sorting domain-containing protein [Hymenobacter ruber]